MLKKIDTEDTKYITPAGQSNNIEILKALVKKIIDTVPRSVRVKQYANFRQTRDMTTLKFLQQFQRKYDCAKIDTLSADQRKSLDFMEKCSDRRLTKALLKIPFDDEFTWEKVQKEIHTHISLDIAQKNYTTGENINFSRNQFRRKDRSNRYNNPNKDRNNQILCFGCGGPHLKRNCRKRSYHCNVCGRKKP